MRLLSWNIHKGIGGRDRKYAIERIFDVLEEQNADIVLLQEVDCGVQRSRFHDQPVLFLERLALQTGLFQLNVELLHGGYGNLLLARWPIPWHRHIDLRWQFKKPRGAQVARVQTPEGPLMVVNWHLGLAEFERQWQVQQLLDHADVQAHHALPTIVAGDCNDWRDQLHKRRFVSADFHHVTTPPSRFRSFPAALPVGPLDKAFARGPLRIRHARIVHGPVAREASDHLPLVVDFHLAAADDQVAADLHRWRGHGGHPGDE